MKDYLMYSVYRHGARTLHNTHTIQATSKREAYDAWKQQFPDSNLSNIMDLDDDLPVQNEAKFDTKQVTDAALIAYLTRICVENNEDESNAYCFFVSFAAHVSKLEISVRPKYDYGECLFEFNLYIDRCSLSSEFNKLLKDLKQYTTKHTGE